MAIDASWRSWVGRDWPLVAGGAVRGVGVESSCVFVRWARFAVPDLRQSSASRFGVAVEVVTPGLVIGVSRGLLPTYRCICFRFGFGSLRDSGGGFIPRSAAWPIVTSGMISCCWCRIVVVSVRSTQFAVYFATRFGEYV